MAYEKEIQVGMAAAIAAANLCQQVRASIPESIEKEDKSPVTVADYGAQALIVRAIAAEFPHDPVVGEEEASALRSPQMAPILEQVTYYVGQTVEGATPDGVADWIDRGNGQPGDRFWTLDPIDGTKGFLRGDQYAIALALIEGGEVKAGILACPALYENIAAKTGQMGLLFVAVRGEGTQMVPISGGNLTPVRVVEPNDKANYRFVESVETAHGDRALQETIAEQVGITTEALRIDSQAKYGAVACGQAALYLRLPSPKKPDYREKIWDHAAGAICVEEAGGKVTDMFGKPLDFSKGKTLLDNQGVVGSNGTLHEKAIATLQEQLAARAK